MLWEPVQWFVSLVEVIAVVAAILAAGVIIAKTAFWVLSRILSQFAGAHTEPDPDEYEVDPDPPAGSAPVTPGSDSESPRQFPPYSSNQT
jgi:hypothetical protein